MERNKCSPEGLDSFVTLIKLEMTGFGVGGGVGIGTG